MPSVTLNAVATADAYSSSNGSFTGLTIAAGTNIALVIMCAYTGSASALGTIGVTWGGVTCPQIGTTVQASDGTSCSALFGLVNPATGNKTVALSASGTGAGSIGVYIDAIAFNNVNQTGGTATFAHFNSAMGDSAAPAVTVTTNSSGDAVVVLGNSFAQNASSVNYTEIFMDQAGQNNGWANYALGVASPSMSAVINGTATWVQIGVDVVASGAAAAACPSRTRTLLGVGCGIWLAKKIQENPIVRRRGLILPFHRLRR